jgi:hypothetical protein
MKRALKEKNGSQEEPSTPQNNRQGVQQAIAKKAYELFEKRGGSHGYDREDWLEAERLVLSEQRPGAPIQKPLSRIPRPKAVR